jgi:hypothetical protein
LRAEIVFFKFSNYNHFSLPSFFISFVGYSCIFLYIIVKCFSDLTNSFGTLVESIYFWVIWNFCLRSTLFDCVLKYLYNLVDFRIDLFVKVQKKLRRYFTLQYFFQYFDIYFLLIFSAGSYKLFRLNLKSNFDWNII